MKKLTTLVFAALIAATLSMPAWSQATPGNQQKAAETKNQSKEDKKAKKQAKGKKKADKNASKKTDKKQ
jgi:hypothetical protein